MAITTLIPTFEIPRSGRPFLSIISVRQATARVDSRRFIFAIGLVVTLNILVVAVVNILLTQDAFTLQHLKHQRNITMDQRDAVMKIVDSKNSPDQLAAAASKLGMVPAPVINYLNMETLK
jgi:hypothetical protein